MTRKTFASCCSLALIMLLAAPATFAQDRRRLGAKARAGLTAGSGAALGAGVGALLGGKRGLATGALLGGGGATTAWLLKNKDGRRRLGKYGQPVATIGAGTAVGAGIGALLSGKRGAGIGALLGGGGSTAAYLLTRRRNNHEYRPSYGNSYYRPRRAAYRPRSNYRHCRC